MWVIVCLGITPLVYGTFIDEISADEWIETHHLKEYPIHDPNGNPPIPNESIWLCHNGIEKEEHHILQLEDLS